MSVTVVAGILLAAGQALLTVVPAAAAPPTTVTGTSATASSPCPSITGHEYLVGDESAVSSGERNEMRELHNTTSINDGPGSR
jgi:hypothetical protein